VPDDPLMTPDERPALRGLALDEASLRQIYAGNFQRIVGATRPRPLNDSAVDELLAEARLP